MARTPRDNSEAELDAFDTTCRRLGGFDDRISTEWADGYLTALAAGPLALAIDDWLPMLAVDAFERAFADPEDAVAARAALVARWVVLLDHLDPEELLDDPEALRLHPLVSLWDDEARAEAVEKGWIGADEQASLVTGAVWAEGVLEAIDDFAEHWQAPRADDEARAVFEDLLRQVAALTLDEGSAELQAHIAATYPGAEPPPRDRLLDEACFALQDLRVWWLDQAPRPPTRRVEAQPGRNDPCPCGSGKKFKKCHGA